MANLVYDGDYSTAQAVTNPELSAPIAGVNANYLLRQDFMQSLSSFVALALNTPHPTYSTYYLVDESEKVDIGGGLVRWTRTYAQVPASYSEPGGNYAYSFIGFYGQFGINVTQITGRERQTEVVPVRINRDFFLVGPGQIYTDPNDIPTMPEQQYYSGSPTLKVNYIGDSPPLQIATTPSRTAYDALVAAGSEIVVEASTIFRWMGNIYVRETRYVTAK